MTVELQQQGTNRSLFYERFAEDFYVERWLMINMLVVASKPGRR